MIALNIDNPEIERLFLDYAKREQKCVNDVLVDIINKFFEKEPVYQKKDVKKHIVKRKVIELSEDLDDVILYSHIKDSGKYIHDLRRIKK